MIIKNIKNKLSFILYEGFGTPKYFEINKSFLKIIIVGLPLLSIISISMLILGAVYFKELKLSTIHKIPPIIKQLKSEKQNLHKKITKLKQANMILQEKLILPPAKDSQLSEFSIFAHVAGQKDLSAKKYFDLNDVKIIKDNSTKNITIKFKLMNATQKGQRVSGLLFIILQSGPTLRIYPTDLNNSTQLKFTKGEPFATSRFRPFQAIFKNIHNSSDFVAHIIVFSRNGDIIYKHILNDNNQESNNE